MNKSEQVSNARPGIYAITNTANGKQYIGQSVNLVHRWVLHRFYLRRNHHHSQALQRAWNKYGPDSFIFTVLEYVEPGEGLRERLAEREQWYMDIRLAARGSREYNIAPAAGSQLGFRHTPESRERMSAAHRRENLSEETRACIRAAAQRRSAHPTWRENISATKSGQRWTERQRAVWNANRDRPLSALEQQRQERWRQRGLEIARSGVRSPRQQETLRRWNTRRRGSRWTERQRSAHGTNLSRLAQHAAAMKAAAAEHGEAILHSFDALTQDQGASLSVWQRVQMVAAEHAISYAVVYERLRTRYPELIVSPAEKGEATRQRMLAAVQDFEAQGGQPHHMSLRELARVVAPAGGVTPAGAERIIARLRRGGALPPTDYVQPVKSGWRHTPEARAKMSAAMRASTARRRHLPISEKRRLANEAMRGRTATSDDLARLEAGWNAKRAARQAAIERMFDFLQHWPFDTHPLIGTADIAMALGVSYDSVRRYTSQLKREGRIDRNYRPCLPQIEPSAKNISQPALFD